MGAGSNLGFPGNLERSEGLQIRHKAIQENQINEGNTMTDRILTYLYEQQGHVLNNLRVHPWGWTWQRTNRDRLRVINELIDQRVFDLAHPTVRAITSISYGPGEPIWQRPNRPTKRKKRNK